MHDEPHFRLDIANAGRGLHVLSFSGTEAISQLFTYELEVLIDDPELDLHSLMYRAAFLHFKGPKSGVHGQIQGIVRSHFRPGPACYQLTLGPRLACLGQRYTPRVFQQMTAPQIISRVLLEHGIDDDSYRFDLKAECSVREYCAQYQETDLQLVQRLCAQEGIHYHFQHSHGGHELIFGDGLRGFRRTPTAHFPGMPIQSGVSRFSVDSSGADRAQQVATGESSLPFVAAGHLLPLKGHPDTAFNHLWLVTAVQHRGFDPRQLEAGRRNDPALYINQFQATPWEIGFKPDPIARSSTPDIQRARIVGLTGEPVTTDPVGRVRARFDWGDQGCGALFGECWLPVAAQCVTQLRGGMAVVVSFFDDDLDRPVITAALLQPEDIALPVHHGATGRRRIEANLSSRQFIGDERCIKLGDGPQITYEEGSQWSITVGDSRISLDADGLKLLSPQILFAPAIEP
ncbi:MAG TPA: contractile injection system protein, VgrG/Pvc8 family [Pseudomonas sp.]|jgi:type VI secretion system secreted protein VgrG